MNEQINNPIEDTNVDDQCRDLGNNMNELGEAAVNKSDELVQKDKDLASNIQEEAKELASKMQEEASEYTGALADYIKDNPIKSALIAAGIGLLVGSCRKN